MPRDNQVQLVADAMREMPDQVTMHLMVAMNEYQDGNHEDALASFEMAADMYEMVVMD